MLQHKCIISKIHKNRGYPCACCGYLTMSENESGTFEICPVCFWEDDDVQFNDVDYGGGANKESLREARQNFKKFNASSIGFLNDVRPPLTDELP